MANKLSYLEDYENEIAGLTSQLVADSSPFNFDSETGILSFGSMKIKMERADPNIPIKEGNVAMAYPKGFRPGRPEETQKLERKLEMATAGFYETAARIRDIARKEKMPDLSNFECEKVRNVRNHLLAHPNGASSGITLDSFGYSKNEGPFVKCLRQGDQTHLMDQGFVHNSREFVENLEAVLLKSLADAQ